MTRVDDALADPTVPRDPPHPLFRFQRDDLAARTQVEVDRSVAGAEISAAVFGGFLEHLSFAILGGVSAELLSNPTLASHANLTPDQRAELLSNGSLLEGLHLSGGDPLPVRERWLSTPLPTGFGVAVLDAPSGDGVPFGWTSPQPTAVSASVGRVGPGVRLRSVTELCQAVFIPDRVDRLVARLWVRVDPGAPAADGVLEVGLRRRDGGALLARARHPLAGAGRDGSQAWRHVSLELDVAAGVIATGEPVDCFVGWDAQSHDTADLLIDRISLQPIDAIDGLDLDVIETARALGFSRLRWPGGNFASVYHWRDGVGPIDRRPTVRNEAWGGLEYHLFGTDEYILFCRAIGAEPHITVNSGTGSAEEAAAWVEYCNGPTTTPMGALRASHGHEKPYNVRVWEVGNEMYGTWQAGFHGAEENALRFRDFAAAMRSTSPIPLQLIACGNSFDFVAPGPAYDHVAADGAWHDELLRHASDQVDLISLHSLPMNDTLLDEVDDDQAQLAVLGQVVTWERRFLPELLRRCDQAPRDNDRPPIGLAMTEWGPLGAHPTRLMVENFGAVIYAATFLSMVIRNAERIPIASPNGFMHGGCVRKVGGRIFVDPQVIVQEKYRSFVGARPLACTLTGPGYDIDHPADIGGRDRDVPFIDAIVCQSETDGRLRAALANRHPTRPMTVEIRVRGYAWRGGASVETLAHPDVTARVTPAEPTRFPLQVQRIESDDGALVVSLPPSSAVWIEPC